GADQRVGRARVGVGGGDRVTERGTELLGEGGDGRRHVEHCPTMHGWVRPAVAVAPTRRGRPRTREGPRTRRVRGPLVSVRSAGGAVALRLVLGVVGLVLDGLGSVLEIGRATCRE